MAVGEILVQPQGGQKRDGGRKSETVVKKGDYNDLLIEAGNLHVGESYDYGTQLAPDVRYVRSWDLQRINAGLGVLTIEYGDPASGTYGDDDDEDDVDEDNLIEEKWSIKNVQQQIPLSRFAPDGTWSLGSSPDGHELSLWRQESRKDLYDAYQFLAPDGNVYELSTESKLVADKYMKGIESVMRFYPVVTRTKTYKRGMDEDKIAILRIGAKLSHTDSPTKTFGLAPGAWLCIQDEGEFSADGTFVRTTGWMGCKSLDADLYGDNDRWEPMN